MPFHTLVLPTSLFGHVLPIVSPLVEPRELKRPGWFGQPFPCGRPIAIPFLYLYTLRNSDLEFCVGEQPSRFPSVLNLFCGHSFIAANVTRFRARCQKQTQTWNLRGEPPVQVKTGLRAAESCRCFIACEGGVIHDKAARQPSGESG